MTDWKDYLAKCRTNEIVGQGTENVSDKMIGCLCWFSNSQKALWGVVGVLKRIVNITPKTKVYVSDVGKAYEYCRPVKPDEIRFADDSKTIDHIGDNNEKVKLVRKIDELTTKCSQLENDIKTLKEVLLKHCPDLESWVNKNFEA